MQATELDVTISAEGHIFLPPELQSFYGRHVRIILLLDDEPLCSASTAHSRAATTENDPACSPSDLEESK